MSGDKAYLVWQPLCGHVFGAYWAPTPERALAEATTEFDIETEPPERVEALDIEDMLTASIRRLADADWTAGVSGYRHCVYLDPARCEVYQWSHVGAGCPEPVWAGRHLAVFEDQGRADLIPASVVGVLLDRVGLLVRVCAEHANGVDADDSGTAHCELERWHPEIQQYWDPASWYELSHSEIEALMAQGHSPDEIVDQLETGDDYNGRVRVEAAREYMAEHVEGVLTAAIDEITTADDRDSLWDAVSHACTLHYVPVLARDSYLDLASAARARGHGDLAAALTEAWIRDCKWGQEDLEPDEPLLSGRAPARVCYGCGQPLDQHAGLSVVYCGRCGDS